jgi:phytoene synthase
MRFATWDELRQYCYQVASVVGLCCVRIWGGTDARTIPLAEAAGVAFQLTNILRDVASDARQGRVYLPGDLLAQSGCSFETILQQEWNEAVRAVMQSVAERAKAEYARARDLNTLLPATGRAVWGVMFETYQGLLDQIIAQRYLPTTQRPRTSRWRKVQLLLRAIPVRLGWKDAV